MEKYSFCFVVLLSALFFASCKSTSAPIDNIITYDNKDVIWPLAVNNEWVYDERTYDSTGKLINEKNVTSSITKDSVRLGERIYLLNTNEGGAVNRSDGLWELDLQKDEQYLFLKYPCKLNDTYSSRPNTTTTVVSMNESITVPSGTYTCIKYVREVFEPSINKMVDRWVYYACPKVGMIRFELYDLYKHPVNPPVYSRTDLVRVSLH